MGRPRKIKTESINEQNNVKSTTNFPILVCDPTSFPERVLEAYSKSELDGYLAGGWLIYTPE